MTLWNLHKSQSSFVYELLAKIGVTAAQAAIQPRSDTSGLFLLSRIKITPKGTCHGTLEVVHVVHDLFDEGGGIDTSERILTASTIVHESDAGLASKLK
ncbi:hypothetical protein TNCT_474771 [Trichonephila clavata]|uniref:Uncharacterized protein n=1 Tax=Trichonephila clavata TaxID=2740835 RepID=A0A8X6FFV0_TRICU|nr:hypothetical protein TNCT_474771 [Trichonephila clavata]